jgi:hypothetical protein
VNLLCLRLAGICQSNGRGRPPIRGDPTPLISLPDWKDSQMSRRLLTSGLMLAALWGAPTGFNRVAAKPPDLPIVENDVLTSSSVVGDESSATAPLPAATQAEIPPVRQLRPSVQRTLASCLLFGLHPLLALAPTDDYLDADLDDYAPAPTPFPSPSSSPTGNVSCLHFQVYHDSICPYVRQQQCVTDRHAVLFADPDFSRDVLQNLEALRKSRELLDKAREFSRNGRTLEALDALRLAAELCPGSRFDEEIQAAAAQILCNGTVAERKIDQNLSRPVTLKFVQAPLGQLLDDLRGWTDLNLCVDAAALDAAEVSLDHLISIQVENVPIRSALGLVLREAHLTYLVKNDVVLITTEASQRAANQPPLPPVDGGIPAALDHLFSETLKVGLTAANEEQEAPPVSLPHSSLEFGFGLDGGFRMFAQLRRGGAVWHFECGQKGLTWWASPDGGADEDAPRCTGFNIDAATSP